MKTEINYNYNCRCANTVPMTNHFFPVSFLIYCFFLSFISEIIFYLKTEKILPEKPKFDQF